MTLPKSVQAQIDKADSLYQEAYGTQEEAPEAASEPEQEAEQQEPEASTTQTAEKQPENQEDESRDALYWKHRFQVLQGKYNAEVPALREEIRNLKQQIEQQSQATDKANELADTISSQLTDDELELLGPELVQVIQKLVGKGDQSEVEQLKQEVNSLKQSEQEHAEAEFWAVINSRIPDWQQLQSTPEAQQWLAAFDAMTGATRNQLLQQAQQNLNAYQVVEIFNQLRQATTGNASRVPAEKVTPRQSRASGGPKPQGNAWTREAITQFYRDKTTGKYSDDEAALLEADLFKAQVEGRVY